MPNQDPILILTASAGAGHTVAARAIEEAFRSSGYDGRVEVLDLLQLSNSFFRTLYAQGYLGLVRVWPAGFGMIYEVTDRPQRNRLRSWFQQVNMSRAMRFLVQSRPQLIINTHFLPAEIVAHLRRAGRLNCPQVTVTTDFETHRLWAQNPTERYYTATPEGRAYLATWGAPPESIRVTGIPVRAAFAGGDHGDRAAARAPLGLAPDRPVVLLLCGGFGVGPVAELLRALLAVRPAAQIVAIAGKNEPLRSRLESVARQCGAAAKVIGFTEQMHDWMRAADLVVTKTGGLTTAEALACGLPMVIVNPIPGQEARNSDYLLENGAAIKVNNARLLGFRVERLLADPPRLATMRRNAAALARPSAAAEIVADALTLLR